MLGIAIHTRSKVCAWGAVASRLGAGYSRNLVQSRWIQAKARPLSSLVNFKPVVGHGQKKLGLRAAYSSQSATSKKLPSQDSIREHVKSQFSLHHKNVHANMLPVETYKASYMFNPYPINFNIYYHYVTVAGLRFANLCFRYFDRGLLELLGPYGVVKAFSYAAFKLELLITGYIPHYLFYAVASIFGILLLYFSPLNVPVSLLVMFAYAFMAL